MRPELFRQYAVRWYEAHPGWEHMHWHKGADLPKLRHQDLYDRAEEVCPNDWKRFRSDLVRLELLYSYGGVYADCDTYPFRPLGELLNHHSFIAYSPQRGANGERILTQAVIAAEPQHPFIGACLDAIPEAVECYRDRPLAQMIGPWLITRTYEAGEWPDVTTYSEEFWDVWVRHEWANRRYNRKGGLA